MCYTIGRKIHLWCIVLCPPEQCVWLTASFFNSHSVSNPPHPLFIYDSLRAMTLSHGGRGLVIAGVVSGIRGGPVACTLPAAIKLLNILAIVCPFEPAATIMNPDFVGIALGPVFGEAGPDIIAANVDGAIISLFRTGLLLQSSLWPSCSLFLLLPLGWHPLLLFSLLCCRPFRFSLPIFFCGAHVYRRGTVELWHTSYFQLDALFEYFEDGGMFFELLRFA